MTTFCFEVDAQAFCNSTKTATLGKVQDFSFCIQVHKERLLTDLFMTFPCGGVHDYEVHASSQVDVLNYSNSSGMSCNDPRLIEIVDREAFNACFKNILDLPKGSTIQLQASNNNRGQLFDAIRFIYKTSDSEGSMPVIKAEEVDGAVLDPDDYDMINDEARIRYDSEDPREIMFHSERVPGYWITTTILEPGSIAELNTIRGGIERENAPVVKGDSYIMGKARRGRKTATTPTSGPDGTQSAEPLDKPSAEPKCKACGDTGQNSKGGPCICQQNTAPPPPPVGLPEEPPAPEATTKAPPASEEGSQDTASSTESDQATKDKPQKKPSRRSKAQIRADYIEDAFRILTEESGAEDVTDKLVEFCKSVLQSRGYTVEMGASSDEALTLQERLGKLGDELDGVLGRLVLAKDSVLAAQASSEGLLTKGDLFAKLENVL